MKIHKVKLRHRATIVRRGERIHLNPGSVVHLDDSDQKAVAVLLRRGDRTDEEENLIPFVDENVKKKRGRPKKKTPATPAPEGD